MSLPEQAGDLSTSVSSADVLVVGVEWLVDSPDQGDKAHTGKIHPFFPTCLIDRTTAVIFKNARPLRQGLEQ